MAYVEKKILKGKEYYYLTEIRRIGDKLKKTRKYLGTTIPKDLAHLKKKTKKIAKRLASKEAELINRIKNNYTAKFSIDKSLWKTERYRFVDFIYNTNAIEGNTLTHDETDDVLYGKGKIPKRKERDAKEAENMKECIDFLFDYKGELDQDMILNLHAVQHKGTLAEAGKFRGVNVRVGRYICPQWNDVPELVSKFLAWYKEAKKALHPFELAVLAHLKFVRIHPFRDGNGRMSRLLMNFILLKNEYPLLNIFNDNKMPYYLILQKYDFDRKERPYLRYFFEVFVGQYREYL